MSTELRTLPPKDYRGQELCARCGDDGTGTRFYICADGAGYSHEESCAIYRYGGLCAACAAVPGGKENTDV